MILIALGANLPTEAYGPPAAGLTAALALLAEEEGIRVLARSRWWRSAPVPPSDQPWFVNGAARLETTLSPEALLERLLGLERRFGRIRSERNAPRALDLDLLDYDGLVLKSGGPEGLVLPHPRLHERAFVLLPLAELAPAWRHPVSGASAAELLAALPPSQAVRPLDEAPWG